MTCAAKFGGMQEFADSVCTSTSVAVSSFLRTTDSVLLKPLPVVFSPCTIGQHEVGWTTVKGEHQVTVTTKSDSEMDFETV